MDTGLGREGYSNIGQGRIDEILSLKSADRREIFEEAAGISKYRHRKEETERKLVNNSNIDLSCDVLKVGHHGSATSSTAAFLSETKARYGVICVGAGNSYGHPKEAALNRLKTAGIAVYRTDKNGHVVFSTDGTKLTLPGSGGTVGGTLSNTSSGGSSTSSSQTDTFIGNKESRIFHLPTCSSLPDVSKRNYLYNYWFIVNCIGYTPCKVCLKNYVA
jgi:competence protein ComEC